MSAPGQDRAVIREARPADNPAIRALVMTILNEEYGMALRLAELPDLADVHATYRAAGRGNFWVAESGARIRACIGLFHLGRGDFELRRMYVEGAARGQGIAQRLLDVAMAWAATRGVDAIYLETNERWHAAHHIYEKHGFEPIGREALPPEFPVVRVATGFYRLQLPRAAGLRHA